MPIVGSARHAESAPATHELVDLGEEDSLTPLPNELFFDHTSTPATHKYKVSLPHRLPANFEPAEETEDAMMVIQDNVLDDLGSRKGDSKGDSSSTDLRSFHGTSFHRTTTNGTRAGEDENGNEELALHNGVYTEEDQDPALTEILQSLVRTQGDQTRDTVIVQLPSGQLIGFS